eukprot:gene2120-2405_t
MLEFVQLVSFSWCTCGPMQSESIGGMRYFVTFTDDYSRTDNGGEYMSKEFDEYLRNNGFRHESIVPYSPQKNGVVERLHCTLCEKTRSMLAHAALPKKYWTEALAYACYLKNRLPTRAIDSNITPYEIWYGKKPVLVLPMFSLCSKTGCLTSQAGW